MERATKDDMQGRGVDDEHAQAGTEENTKEIPFVADNAPAEGVGEAGLDSEDLHEEYVEQTCKEKAEKGRTLKH